MSGDLPTHAEIVIVGGGAAGASLAWQLTRLGKRDIALLERGSLTCGTSWHAAGLIMQLRSSHAMTDLSHMNAKVYETLEAETGQATGFKQNGTLAIARNDDRIADAVLVEGAQGQRLVVGVVFNQQDRSVGCHCSVSLFVIPTA